MATITVTPVQRWILRLMRDHNGIATFGIGKRKRYHAINGAGELIIYCYQAPEFFLARRQLIKRMAEPYTYVLTDAGRLAAGEGPP